LAWLSILTSALHAVAANGPALCTPSPQTCGRDRRPFASRKLESAIERGEQHFSTAPIDAATIGDSARETEKVEPMLSATKAAAGCGTQRQASTRLVLEKHRSSSIVAAAFPQIRAENSKSLAHSEILSREKAAHLRTCDFRRKTMPPTSCGRGIWLFDNQLTKEKALRKGKMPVCRVFSQSRMGRDWKWNPSSSQAERQRSPASQRRCRAHLLSTFHAS